MDKQKPQEPEQEGQESEVKRLREQIQKEYEAAQRGLEGLASGTARHQYITWRMERLGILTDELKKISPDEAKKALEEMDQWKDGEK